MMLPSAPRIIQASFPVFPRHFGMNPPCRRQPATLDRHLLKDRNIHIAATRLVRVVRYPLFPLEKIARSRLVQIWFAGKRTHLSRRLLTAATTGRRWLLQFHRDRIMRSPSELSLSNPRGKWYVGRWVLFRRIRLLPESLSAFKCRKGGAAPCPAENGDLCAHPGDHTGAHSGPRLRGETCRRVARKIKEPEIWACPLRGITDIDCQLLSFIRLKGRMKQ
jgi:hypothetical protein